MSESKVGRDLLVGDIVKLHGDFHVVVSMGPCDTLPREEAKDYVEPGLVKVVHQRDDRWVRTHWFTYMLFRLSEHVRLYNGIRVQQEYKHGPFETYAQRTAYIES